MSATCVLTHRTQPDRLRPAAPNALLCRGCIADVRRILIGEDHFHHGQRTRTRGLAELWDELDQELPAGGTATERTSGTRERSLPFNNVVSEHRRDIQDILAGWVLQHVDDNVGSKPDSVNPHDLCRWLELRLDHALKQDWVGEYVGELRHLRGKAHALLDPVRRTRFVIGTCTLDDCCGWLVADVVTNDPLLPAVIYCDHEPCSAEWPPHRWIELGRALGKDKAA